MTRVQTSMLLQAVPPAGWNVRPPDKTATRGRFSFVPLAKQWSDLYDDAPMPDEDLSYMEELRLLPLEPKRGCVELFARAYDDDFIPPELETIIRLYGSVERTDLDEQTKGTIWLDDRTSSAYPPASSSSSPGQRPYHHGATPPLDPHTPDSYCHSEIDNNPATGTTPGVPEDASTESASARYSPTSRRPNVPLTAKMLYTLLREERFKHKILPDSDRRLIFILDPDGHDFVALMETVPYHQHKALKDIITKYHDFQPSMGVSLSTSGMSSYQLDFHLPFFAMRTDKLHAQRKNIKPFRDWINLSFLAHLLPEPTEPGDLGLYPAQISLTLCGTSVRQYVGYGFEDAEFDPDREFGDEEFSLNEFHADQMTRGKQDANLPVWDPREYFLLNLRRRVEQICEEWGRVVHDFNKALRAHPSHPLKLHDRMLEVFGALLPVLEDTIEMWQDFLGANGDHGYFSNSTPKSDASHFGNTLHSIDKEFLKLKKYYRALSRMQNQCEKAETSLGARMMQQNNYIAVLMVQYIGPLSLVTSFFSIEEPVVKFERNLVSFLGLNFVLIVLVHFVRLVVEGNMYRPHWWETIAIRAKRTSKDNSAITKKNAAGDTVVQRRRTHSWFKKTK